MTPSTEGKLREALALANSMILSGEPHSEASRKMIAEALSTPSQPVEGNEEIVRQIITIGGADFQKKLVDALSAKDAEKAVVQEKVQALTTSNKGLLDVMEKIAREKIIKDHCAATGSAVYMQKIAQQALEQFGGGR